MCIGSVVLTHDNLFSGNRRLLETNTNLKIIKIFRIQKMSLKQFLSKRKPGFWGGNTGAKFGGRNVQRWGLNIFTKKDVIKVTKGLTKRLKSQTEQAATGKK